MKHTRLALFALGALCMVCTGPLYAQDEPTASAAETTGKAVDVKHYGELEDYRRSSLCLIMLTHQGTKYAEEMQRQFLEIPLPSRYNPHNIDVRVISTSHGKVDKEEIMRIMKQRGVAKELVRKWFNYNSRTGTMNMDRIHARGGYNATYADLERATSSERGTATLSDEGVELIQNTFVLVCDMSYYNREKTGQFLSILGAVATAYLDVSAEEQAKKGNYKQADNLRAGADLARVGTAVAADLGGFSVKIYAHLLRLKWDDNLTQKMFAQYWVDDDTPAGERRSRQQAFDNDNSSFQLEYVGQYKAKTGKTVFKSQNDMDAVIRRVCANTIDEGMGKLAKSYVIFRPKTAFYCDNGMIYAYIGRKEGVAGKSKYEVVQKKKKKGEFTYSKVDQATPYLIWDNRNINMEEVDLSKVKGTSFRCKKGKVCNQGYLLREAK